MSEMLASGEMDTFGKRLLLSYSIRPNDLFVELCYVLVNILDCRCPLCRGLPTLWLHSDALCIIDDAQCVIDDTR